MNLEELIEDVSIMGTKLGELRTHYDNLMHSFDDGSLDLLEEFPYLDERSNVVLLWNAKLSWQKKSSERHGFTHQLSSLNLLSILVAEQINTPFYQVPKFRLHNFFVRIPSVYDFFERRYRQRVIDQLINIVKQHQVNVVFSFTFCCFSNCYFL